MSGQRSGQGRVRCQVSCQVRGGLDVSPGVRSGGIRGQASEHVRGGLDVSPGARSGEG